MTVSSYLPIMLVAGPLLGAALVPWLGRRSESARNAWMVAVTALTLLGAIVLLAGVMAGDRIHAELPMLLGRLEFAVDHVGALFALFSAFVWFCATLFSLEYMKTQRSRNRYQAVSLVVLGASLGVVLAGNLVTLYVFFEALGLVALLLVVHTGTAKARSAAIQYFWMTLFGGVALLAGIMIMHSIGGGSLLAGGLDADAGRLRTVAAALLVTGFGVKAGMVPLHAWLPNAHPVAPAPASALLSGVMIKAGAYGIFRTVSALFRPEAATAASDAGWQFSAQLGLVILWLGIATMAVGVVLALGQRDAKRMLAYHSISQMGFILTGLGAGAYLLDEGAMGTAGGLMHAVNHALFKASLFLGIGAVAFRSGSVDMYELGGLWRRMPMTFALMLVAAAGITGLPLFNGFVSKSMVHHALEAAYARGGAPGLPLAGYIYLLVCAGTAASFIKLIGLVFLGRSRAPGAEDVREAPPLMLLAMGLLSLPIIVLGLRPALLLEGLLQPGLLAQSLPADGIARYLSHYFLSGADVLSALGMFGLGGLIFVVGMKFGLFHRRPPVSAYRHASTGERFLTFCRRLASAYGHLQHRISWALFASRRGMLAGMRATGRTMHQLVESVVAGGPGSPGQAFMEAAWVELERERDATIKAAMASVAAGRRGPQKDSDSTREALLESARAVAGLLAGSLFEARVEMLREQGRGGAMDSARSAFSSLHQAFPDSRATVAQAVAELAGARCRGENVATQLAAILAPIARQERGAIEAAARATPVPGAEQGHGAVEQPGAAAGLAAWLRDMSRLVAAELRQHQSAWPRSEALDEDPGVLVMRRRIQRYARDVGLNVAAIFLLLALFAATLWHG